MNRWRSRGSMPRSLTVWPIILLAGCSLMTSPEDDPMYLKMTEIDNRLDRVERLTDNEGLTNLSAKLDALQTDVQELRNAVETLQHESEQSSGRQRDLYLDVDQRLQTIEQAAARSGAELAAVAGGALIAGQLAVPGGSDRENYQAAFDLMKQGQYDEAAAGFRQFLVAFPTSGLTDNAQYWLAETYYVGQDFPQALIEFQALLERYPDSSKIPDALLKIGYCNYELGAWDASRTALSTVVKRYPETTAARLASQRLDRMKSEGH